MLLHYRMVEKIGLGSMDAVWRAVDTTLDREVAIKIRPDEFSADATRLIRFQREAEILTPLTQPEIAPDLAHQLLDGLAKVGLADSPELSTAGGNRALRPSRGTCTPSQGSHPDEFECIALRLQTRARAGIDSRRL